VEVWSEELLKIMTHFGYLVIRPTMIQGKQVGSESEKMCVHWIQERRKGYKIWDPKSKKFILSRD